MAKSDVLVIGGGRFGLLAARRLAGRVISVVEPDPGPKLINLGVDIIRQDGATAAADLLNNERPPVWVVPAVPRHFLADWLAICLGNLDPISVEPPPEAVLPVKSVHQGPHGQYYLSLSDFICPDDCPEPADKCTVTGLARGKPMFERLSELKAPGWHTGVLRSHQLAPGVGGLSCAEMKALRQGMLQKGGRWILATACRCHGVVQGFSLAGKGA